MTEAELLAAVLEAPDDDAPRLVYGDWLLEQADPDTRARGEFIHIQCTLARMADEASPERTALVRREAALLASYRLAWIDAAIPEAMPRRRRWDSMHIEWRFERGFVADHDDNGIPMYTLAANLPAIVAKVPLVKLNVRLWADGDLEHLLALPKLEQMRTLTLSIVRDATKRDLAPLFHSERFANVSELHLDWSNAGSQPPVAAVLASPLAAKLSHLDVSWYQDMEPAQDLGAVADAIVESPVRQRLERLGLRGHALGERAVKVLARATWPRLRRLAIETNDAGIAVGSIARARELAGLEAVHFAMQHGRDVQWAPADVGELVQALPRLTDLALYDQSPQLDVEPLLATAGIERLRALAIRRCGLDDAAAIAIAHARHLGRLRVLDLQQNSIGTKGAQALANAPHLATLRALDLANNGRMGVAPFTKSKYLDGLERLDLRRNSIPVDSPAVTALRVRFGETALVAEDDDPSSRRRR